MNVRTHAVARAAYECVAARRDETKGIQGADNKRYGALAHKLTGMILANGLAQATGFLLAKGNREHLELLDDLCAVLRATETTTAGDGAGLHQEIIDSDLERTLMLTRRSLQAGGWLKRYVQGVLRVDATGERAADDEPSVGDRKRWPRS
ncbi:MAG: type III-B CRISPR module-associated protein Cmr5 [Acidobacteria bacterium]|nr:type III-B CRISPR module-associated protein Cmr5 [Acidobacteriota bacterium]